MKENNMKKLLLIIALSTLPMVAQAELTLDDLVNKCHDVKGHLSIIFDQMEVIEEQGGTVPSNLVAEVLNGALVYTRNCASITGGIFDDDEEGE
jgi:hypothetical protein